MREILFRGKRIDDGEWVEGFYVSLGSKDDHILTGKLSIVGFAFVYEHHPVIHKTVGQYTGLTDKNGVKIFEGDIVESALCLYVVVWSNANAMFCLRDPASKVSYDFFSYFGDYLTVIGNIHDNPELIGGEP